MGPLADKKTNKKFFDILKSYFLIYCNYCIIPTIILLSILITSKHFNLNFLYNFIKSVFYEFPALIFEKNKASQFTLLSFLTRVSLMLILSIGVSLLRYVGIINLAIISNFYISTVVLYMVVSKTKSLLLGFLAAIIISSLFSFLVVYLKIKFNVNEIIVGILLNSFFLHIKTVFLSGFQDPVSVNIKSLMSVYDGVCGKNNISNFFVTFKESFKRVHLVFVLLIILLFLVYVILHNTTIGFEIKIINNEPKTAHYLKINTNKIIFVLSVLSGILIGCGATIDSCFDLTTQTILDQELNIVCLKALMIACISGFNPFNNLMYSVLLEYLAITKVFFDLENCPIVEFIDLCIVIVLYFLCTRQKNEGKNN